MSGSRYLSLAVPESGDIPLPAKKMSFPCPETDFFFFRNLCASTEKKNGNRFPKTGKNCCNQPDLSDFRERLKRKNTKVEEQEWRRCLIKMEVILLPPCSFAARTRRFRCAAYACTRKSQVKRAPLSCVIPL